MHRVGFKMRLFAGAELEYAKRHETIWPELAGLLKDTGISEYSIFLDKETNTLFAYLKVDDKDRLDNLPSSLLMRKWWAYMQDIMDTNSDGSPVSIPLQEVFYLP